MRKAPPTLVRGAFWSVDLLGRYSKCWQAEQLRKIVKLVEHTPPRRPAKPSSKVQARRLDRRLAATTIAELVDDYKAGTSSNQLCEQYNLSKGGLLKILRDHGVEMRYQPMTEDEIVWAVRLYGEGQSLNAVARQLGKAKGSVWKALRERGVRLRWSPLR
ncbi:helix-turn-helix domain-containing protein [Nocardia sp. NBC_00508]|uniref:helix-turn-helix domain-containing protein n=1 Tax=Nocardia sp. NBC_00508 TaxID=2975992 RepID=UPI002E807BC0|nr:helix-turn-helix domain-containing protein [Nocardia sp. NBC_00508]WUD67314.1 helix-turn-helix domain-containing protein [Nocardia sp. NBC_00508]